MKVAIFILIGAMFLVGAVGFWMYQPGGESSEEVGVGEESGEEIELIEEKKDMDSVGNQFIQRAPAGEPVFTELEKEEDSGSKKDIIQEEGLVKVEKIVSITDTGFVPENITVSVGTEVVFVNNGQGMHWPVFDSYPSMSGFDTGHGLYTGEKRSFVFTEKGEWGYRDGLTESLKGMVIVE